MLLSETEVRLIGWWTAFDNPFVLWVVIGLAVALVVSGLTIQILARSGKLDADRYRDLWRRWLAWLALTLCMVVPILLGAAWVIAGACVLSLLCYREFARATGLFREKLISLVVVVGILALTFASADNFARLYFALAPLTVGLVAIATLPQDRPQGYIQRTALGVLAFLLFGHALGYLGMLANNPDYRALLLLIFVGVVANELFTYWVGKMAGGPKLLPNTSPNKTVAGCLGALMLTTLLVGGLGHLLFQNTAVDRLDLLVILGAGMSILGQCGALLLSAIKRDLGLKEIGDTGPGPGGFLDRLDSWVLVPPALFHFLSLYLGPLHARVAERIVTGP
jgi:phosphatidate cytidylyltransferase